jgi:two-component system NtrC family sensor kinase
MRSEKLSTIGTMVSGVAHELNNPLTAVIGNTQLLMRKAGSNEMRAKLNTVFREAQRAAGIVSGLLSFARERKPERRATNINDIIAESLKTAGFDMKANSIRLRQSLARGLPDADCDPFQIKQAFISIVANAYDALVERGGGTINIRTFLRYHSIIIECEDDGPGIPPDLVKRVFDPFFTTKEVGKGTGLGLSMAYGIIREHGGEIMVESQPGKGTKFIIDLPIAAPGPEKTMTSTHEAGHLG